MAAKPDGYTFGSGAISSALSSPFYLDSPPFDLKKIHYIGGYAIQERLLFASVDKPYKTWAEFLEQVRKNPGTMSIGFGGAQWSLEVVKSIVKKEGLQIKLVMFKTGGEASSAMLGGHVDLVETGSGTPAYQAARQGKLVPLINLGAHSDPHFPHLKNVVALGYPYSCSSDYGMVVPAGVPEPIRAKLEKALKDTLAEKPIQETLMNMGLNYKFYTGKEYEPVVRKVVEDTPKLAEYVKDVK
jgi:tripartite-type tricarboxylate transporter receptor subunit TctC